MPAASWLSKKYIDLVSVQLPKFRWLKPTVGTYRCVFCGDSERNPNKTRGYIYEGKGGNWFTKCHNCQASVSFQKLLKFVDPTLYREFVFEVVKESGGPKPPVKFLPRAERPSTPRTPPLPTIASLPDDHPARIYIEKREIPETMWSRLWYTETWGTWLKSIGWDAENQPDDGPRLVIPFLDADRRLVVAQGRALFKCKPTNRYLTAKANADVLKVYGRDHWDSSAPTWMCEGPLDSLFIPNALAAAGSDILSLAEQLGLDPTKTTVVFDNEPRNRAIIAQTEKAIAAGYSCVIWSNTVHQKDINDLALRFPGQYQEMLTSWVYSGPRARMELTRWRRDAVERARWVPGTSNRRRTA